MRELGRLDILVSNAAWQNRKESLDELDEEEWRRTFRTNIDAYFHLAKAAIPHMAPGSAIIATSSETGLMGERAAARLLRDQGGDQRLHQVARAAADR